MERIGVMSISPIQGSNVTVSASFQTLVVEQLSRVLPGVRARPMFGGVGVYSNDMFFALVDDDVLYFKVDDTTRPDFEALGLGPFRPFGDEGETMQYCSRTPTTCARGPTRRWALRAAGRPGRESARVDGGAGAGWVLVAGAGCWRWVLALGAGDWSVIPRSNRY
jgi:DNA transformation protein